MMTCGRVVCDRKLFQETAGEDRVDDVEKIDDGVQLVFVHKRWSRLEVDELACFNGDHGHKFLILLKDRSHPIVPNHTDMREQGLKKRSEGTLPQRLRKTRAQPLQSSRIIHDLETPHICL